MIWDCMLQGQASDIMIRAQEIIRMKQVLTGLYMKHCGKPADVVGGWWTGG
jgi:ATP-dependent Clp protease protease subunit